MEVESPEPSLFEDLYASSTQRTNQKSKLNYDIGCGTTLSHGYTFAVFHFERNGQKGSHAFVWSPRLREFVHSQNWGDCPLATCPWKITPPPSHPIANNLGRIP
jgi:hypothetical protein